MRVSLSLHPGLFIPRLAVWLAVCSDTRQPINRLSTVHPTRGNVQPVVHTWSSPIPSSPPLSSFLSYLDCRLYKCKQRDCRVPELTQTHHDANRMGGGQGGEGKKNCPLMATKLPCVKPPSGTHPTLAACVDPDGTKRSCSRAAAVEAVRASGLRVIL